MYTDNLGHFLQLAIFLFRDSIDFKLELFVMNLIKLIFLK